MNIQFENNFFKSINKIIHRNTWIYKTYDLFRYDIPRFLRNIWKFRKALWNHYWFDHHGTLMFLEIGLLDMSDNIKTKGMEVDESRLKKVASMRRAASLIRNYNEDLYIDMAEFELGNLVMYDWEFEEVPGNPDVSRLIDKETPEEKEHNRKVFQRAREIEEKEWNDLIQILKGQDYSKFDDKIDWNKQFDGSGIRGWWD